MMKYRLMGMLLLLASTNALAAGESKWYAAFDYGQGNLRDACPPAQCKPTDTAMRIGGGYSFSPYLGTELGYGNFGTASFHGQGQTKVSGWVLSGIAGIPFDKFAVYAKLNIVRAETKNTTNQTQTTTNAVGLGAIVQYNLSKSLGVRLQYDDLGRHGDRNTTGESWVDMVTLGATYRF
jgi:opacity protein-like surface antigen